jgi:hypothetical protein
MTTPTPAPLNLTLSRSSGFTQDLLVRSAGSGQPLRLRGYRFYAQLWAMDRSLHYLDLEVPVVEASGGTLLLQLRSAVSQGILTETNALSGGDAEQTGTPPELSGGAADTSFSAAPLSGGRAWMGVLPPLSRWDLLRVNGGNRRVWLRGVATLVA